MKYRKKVKTLLVTAGLCALVTGTIYAAENKPVDVAADTVEYNSKSGQITAKGNVVMLQDGARITGAEAQYNAKTQEAVITGGVVADKEDMHMTADNVRTAGKDHMIASGSVVATKADKTLTGPVVEYFADRQYMLVPSSAKVVMKDGVFTSDKMEAYLNEDHLIGTGNVHIVSAPRNLEAFGDQADYYGKEDGKVILTGNAVATQDNNTLKSNRLTLYLADGQAEVKE